MTSLFLFIYSYLRLFLLPKKTANLSSCGKIADKKKYKFHFARLSDCIRSKNALAYYSWAHEYVDNTVTVYYRTLHQVKSSANSAWDAKSSNSAKSIVFSSIHIVNRSLKSIVFLLSNRFESTRNVFTK